MGYSEILSELKQKKYRPIYFLQGEEPYYMDKITDFISNNVLKEGERDFNQTILYGKDVTVQDIVNTSKRYPMMAPYQVVIVKEAQHLIRTIDQLSTYAENPTTTTILVFNYKYKKLDGRKALGKQLKKLGYLETFDKIRDYKLPDWIVDYCRDESLQISPKGAMMLSEFLGNDLNKISNTIEKLKVVLDGDTTIDASVIERNVGISKEFNLFELHGALADKDILKANLICNHFGENPKNYPLVVTLSSLYGYFTKLMKYHFSCKYRSRKRACR